MYREKRENWIYSEYKNEENWPEIFELNKEFNY